MSNAHHSFNVEDAENYGVECAVLLFNIRFWLDKNKANGRNIKDGRVWTYNTTEAFSELFPYLTESQIYRRLRKLENEGVLKTARHNKHGYDQTKWYTVDSPPYKNLQNHKRQFTELKNADNGNEETIPYSKPDKKPDSDAPPLREIPNQDQVEAYFRDKGGILEADIPLEAEKFINHYAEEEWETRSGKRIKNWHRQAGTWIANYKKWNRDKIDTSTSGKSLAELHKKGMEQSE